MKLSVAALLLLATSFASADLLRSSAKAIEQVADSACNGQHDQTSCFATIDEATGSPCSWCECAAVPSECLSPEQAKLVPPSVFDCKTPGREFLFNRGDGSDAYHSKLHSHRVEDTKDDEFCDSSSKSISGYFEVKGSKYDEKGEDKHYFYWMFEKRGTTQEDLEKGDIPFVVWLNGGPGCSSSMVRDSSCSIACSL